MRGINIFLGNHNSTSGVEDYISLLKKICGRAGLLCAESSELKAGSINVVIDEFTNAYTNQKIKDFKKNGAECKFIFVLTEFITDVWPIRSFNCFGGVLDKAVVVFSNIAIKFKRKDIGSINKNDILAILVYFPAIIINLCILATCYKKRELIKEWRKIAYNHARYLGMMAMIKYSDGIVLSHPSIIDCSLREIFESKTLGIVYPEFNIDWIRTHFFLNKEPGVEITGSVTQYRKAKGSSLRSKCITFGVAGVIGPLIYKPFFATKIEVRGSKYSYHPVQSNGWPHCSPTRIYRAIQQDGNLPIVDHILNDHPIEKLALELRSNDVEAALIEICDIGSNRQTALDHMLPKLDAYNKHAIEGNDRWMDGALNV